MDILVVMPFGEHKYVRDAMIASTDFDIIYQEIIKKAVGETGNIAVRADEFFGAGDVTTQLMDRIVSSPVMIADVSMPNGNVYFELGVRQGPGDPNRTRSSGCTSSASKASPSSR